MAFGARDGRWLWRNAMPMPLLALTLTLAEESRRAKGGPRPPRPREFVHMAAARYGTARQGAAVTFSRPGLAVQCPISHSCHHIPKQSRVSCCVSCAALS